MSVRQVTRRTFVSVVCAVGLGALVGCPRPRRRGNGVVVFRRSGRGLHVSNAAKKHNANHLYRTMTAALNDAPHPGDNSKVVEVTISRPFFNQIFGLTRTSADLRHVV